MPFADRRDAGRRLAARLKGETRRPIVLALARGGVAVGVEVARALAAPLEVLLAQKLGAPGEPELALGAIAEGRPPVRLQDDRLITALRVAPETLAAIEARAGEEIARRRLLYRDDRPLPALEGASAIVVDDGVATGATMGAALRAVRAAKPARLVLAVPVAATAALGALRAITDEIVCLECPDRFLAVGQFYASFRQVSDAEVLEMLAEARGGFPPKGDALRR